MTLLHRGVERGLAQPLLEDAGRMQQLVGDDGVVHAHAAFVENAQDGLVATQVGGQRAADGLGASGGSLTAVKRRHVAGVVRRTARRPASGAGRCRKKSSVKSSLHSVLYVTPALVSEPLRLSMPTRPGHSPLQLATVRMGPRWVESPGST